MPAKRMGIVAASSLAVTMLCIAGVGAEEPFSIDAHDNLISVAIGEPASLHDVLVQLGDKLDAVVDIDGELGLAGPIVVERSRIDVALRLLAPGKSYSVHYEGKRGAVSRIVMIGKNSIGKIFSRPAPARQDEKVEVVFDAANLKAVSLRDVVALSYGPRATSSRALEILARDAGEAPVRRAALKALASMVPKKASRFLALRLSTDDNADVRLAAAEALVRIDGRRSHDLIRSAIGRETDGEAKKKLRKLMDN